MDAGPKLTYLDSDVLRAAFEGNQDISSAAWKILNDPSRSFASSVFLELELLPKPCFFKEIRERRFFEVFFASVDVRVEASEQLARLALEEAKRIGAAAIDALHLVSAAQAGAMELITGELESKPLFRSRIVKVVSLRSVRF
jgi:hypothetical protein